MFDLSVIQWLLVILATIFIGFSKTGLPSIGVLVITILMTVFPARESVGILLRMFIMGDAFAIIYYRRDVQWRYLIS